MKLLVVFLLSCFSTWFCVKSDVMLLDATKYSYAGGRKESGKGTAYTFTLKIKNTTKTPAITSLYIKSDTQIFKSTNTAPFILFTPNKNDSTVVEVSLNRHWVPDASGTMVESDGTKKVDNFPIKWDGEALIEYQLSGKKYYLKVEKIRFLPTQNYQ